MVPWPRRSITYIDHLSPTRCRTSRARHGDSSEAGPNGSQPVAPTGSRTGSTCPESTKIPPPYPTRVLRRPRAAKYLTFQVEVLDTSSIASYYKEARHANELTHKTVLGGPMTTAAVEIPGYVTGTWTIDPVHSEVSFVVRHMMVSKVRGRFDKFEGTIVTAPDPLQSTVTATVELSSVNTGEPNRDNHIRSADFFEVESHPHLTFRSTGVRPDGDDFLLDGDLTIRGTTEPVTLKLEVNGFGPDPFGGTRAGFSASGEINRNDFGVSDNGPIPGATGGVIVSEKVAITLESEGVLDKSE